LGRECEGCGDAWHDDLPDTPCTNGHKNKADDESMHVCHDT
jgi:hypothetical protein